MLSFELAGGVAAARRFAEAVDIITLADSLGGVETLVAHPATMTHAGMGPEARQAAGISDGLLRLSIGLEAEVDLISDLEKALRCGRWMSLRRLECLGAQGLVFLKTIHPRGGVQQGARAALRHRHRETGSAFAAGLAHSCNPPTLFEFGTGFSPPETGAPKAT
jgi:hypothetical protein